MMKFRSFSRFAQITLMAFSVVAIGHTVKAAASQCGSLFQVPTEIAKKSPPEKKIGRIEVNALGEPDGGAQIGKDARIIAEVAAKLGLEVPEHQLNIVPSAQLDVMAGTGGHPAPHWHGGYEVLSSGSSARGVLEFVTKGCPTCRAYYSASTPLPEQRSVVMHVAGHNDMSSTSKYQKIRPGDSQLASYQLAQELGRASATYNHDQVALYYQYLLSFSRLQDYTYGTFEEPAMFSAVNNSAPLKAPEPKSFWDAISTEGGFLQNLVSEKKPTSPQARGGWKETYSTLQAMTEMLPPDATEWQRSLIKLHEQSQRMFPSIVQTKIMNEGWATLMQYILARHLPWTSSSDLVKFGQLLSGVAVPSFKNPYWLGLSGWMNLYEQFVSRAENANLSEMEKDKRFIAWARNFYANKNDSDWAKIAIDQRWIEKHRFFLYRETQYQEFDHNQDPEKQKYIALTRDWKRIQRFILSKYVDVKYYYFPSIKVRNPNHTEGRVLLVQDTSLGIPLEITSAVKTLFVIAQVMQKPVEIEALFEGRISGEPRDEEYVRRMEIMAMFGGDYRPEAPKAVKGKLMVSVRGEVTYQVEGKNRPDIAKALVNFIEEYKLNVVGSFHGEMTDYQLREWTKVAMKVSDHVAEPVTNIVEYAPHTGAAVREYLHVVERRLRAAVQASIDGTGPTGTLTGSGITLPVLPEVPEFRYAQNFIQERTKAREPGKIDYPGTNHNHDFHADENGTIIGSGTKLPGDKFSPKKQKNEEGEGEGESEAEDGKGKGKGKGKRGQGDADGDEPSPGQGGGSGNPSNLKIPLRLYGELLGELLQLPNVRRTVGDVAEMQKIRRGSVTKPNGNVLWEPTLISAIDKARAIRKSKGLKYDSSVPLLTLIKESLPLIEPNDVRVSGRMEKPLPDFDALLIVNIDLTGSMMGDRIENAKNLVLNLEALLQAKYGKDHVKLEFVGFDSTARRLTREQAFSEFFGGGTSYVSAVELDKEILSEPQYAPEKTNRYIVTVGDGETSVSDATAYINGIREIALSHPNGLQYASLAITNEMSEYSRDIVSQHQAFKNEWEWASVVQLRSSKDMFRALKGIFGADPDKK